MWGLYAYGAAHTLQEIMTVKSDDILGRVKVYEAIVKGQDVNQAGVPESFRVLMKEFQALGLDLKIMDDENRTLDLKEIEEEEYKDDIKLDIDEIELSSSFDDDLNDDFDSSEEDDDDTDFEENELDNVDDSEFEDEGGDL